MDHGGMDHGHMGDGPMCNMNMLFTWDTTNLCIVFSSWRVTGRASLLFSLLGVVFLTAGYELVREMSRRYESLPVTSFRSINGADEIGRNGTGGGRRSKTMKGMLYAVQVFYSFFIMLLFMTYNGWIMFAVAVGAFVGYMLFSNSSATKSVACH